jgi:hypothetical protein
VVTADAVSSDATVSAIDFCKFQMQNFYFYLFLNRVYGSTNYDFILGVPFYILPI